MKPSTAPAWKSHQWASRRVKVAGAVLTQHTCRRCGRNFVYEPQTKERHAVHVGATHFDRLSIETTARWLNHFCPGERQISDEADLGTRFFID